MPRRKPQPPTSADQVSYITNPARWPMSTRGLCPIKREHDGARQFAYLKATDTKPIIYYGNIWEPRATDRPERFVTYEAIIAAGWKVD